VTRTILLIVLVLLALIVPLSSRRPDAIQRILGLSGGVENLPRALLGIGVAAAAVTILVFILKRLRRQKP